MTSGEPLFLDINIDMVFKDEGEYFKLEHKTEKQL